MSAPVLITTVPFGSIDRAPLDLLERHGIAYELNPYGRRIRPDELLAHLPGRTVLIAGTETISAEAMDAAPGLRLIARASIGLDSVDLVAARKRGIVVTYTPDGPSEAVSEFTIGLMVSLLRGVVLADRGLRAGRWQRLMGRRLARVTVGVIGAGRVGARVIGHLLRGFPGVRVLACDIAAPARAAGEPVQWVDAATVYREADVVTLHVPLTPRTRGMVGAVELAAMKRDAVLINTARGEIVDEAALAAALRDGRLAGAAVDVFSEEPYHGELVALDTCLLTCHMGSMSEDCRARMELEAASEAVAFFEGRAPIVPVPEHEYALGRRERAMKRALVTGAAGFIGSHLVDALLAGGWQVTGLDNFDPFYPREIKTRNTAAHRAHEACTLVEADLRTDDLEGRLDGTFDVIVHLAARAGVRPSIADPVGYQESNIGGTQRLLEFARARGVGQFVFASSSSVYGVNPNVPWREDDQVLLPVSPYAATKVSSELTGHVYSHLYGIRFLAMRLFTVYGPRQRPDLAIHRFARLMLEGRPIPVFGDGSTRRDYTFVADIVQGLLGAIAYTATPYEVINLGNNQTVRLDELIAGLEAALGVKARIERLPDQPGDVPQTWASIDKARTLLGYAPATSYAEGVRVFADWLRREERQGVS